MADSPKKQTNDKKKKEQPSHKLTDPAVVDVLYSSNLAEQFQQENPEPCTSLDPTPQQPLPQYTRSEILPRIAVSQRWHPELHANYSKVWCCQAKLNVDENGKKIPTSKMDLSVVHERCGVKDYEEFVNGNRWKACKNCEPDRFYVPRRPSQDEYEKRFANFTKQKDKGPVSSTNLVSQDSDYHNEDEFDLMEENYE